MKRGRPGWKRARPRHNEAPQRRAPFGKLPRDATRSNPREPRRSVTKKHGVRVRDRNIIGRP